MTVTQFLGETPILELASVLLALILVTASVSFLSAFRKTKYSFWQYIIHLDFTYPVKPNSRLLLNTIRRGFDKNEASDQVLHSIMGEARAIKKSLEDVKGKDPDPKLDRALSGIDAILHQIKVTQESVGDASVPRLLTDEAGKAFPSKPH